MEFSTGQYSVLILFSRFPYMALPKIIQTKETTFIVRCCIYLTTYDWIKSFLKITIEGRAIYGNLENKINTLYWPVENSIHKNNDADDR
jgi:hypothetical protein